MNMMSKIYASTAMSLVELEEQGTTPHTIALPLITPEVSPALATMIKAYVDAVNSYNSREDDDGAEFADGGLMERIIAWPAGGYADLAAKMALSLSELRGRVHMTVDEVEIKGDFALDLHAENLMLAVGRDARKLASGGAKLMTPTSRTEWDQAFSAYIAAKAKYDAKSTPREDDDPDMLARIAAEDELIRTPAPDLMALRTKIDLEYFNDCVPGDSEWKAIKSDVQRLAVQGEGVSPAMAKAVVNWKALTAAYNAACETPDVDEETTIQLCHLSTDAARALGATPAKTMEDFALKVYLLALVECEQTGPSPLNFAPGGDDFEETALWRGIIGDLPQISPSVRALIDGTLVEAESDTSTCHSRPEQPATPDEAHQQRKMPLSPTPIEVLQRLWDQANAAYDLNEKAEGKCSEDEEGEDARALHREAASRLAKEATLLSHSILRQHPTTWRDALHVACHTFNMVDLGQDMNDEDWTALAAGMDGLLAFIADEAEGDEPLTGWNGDALRYVRARVRTRRCADLKAA